MKEIHISIQGESEAVRNMEEANRLISHTRAERRFERRTWGQWLVDSRLCLSSTLPGMSYVQKEHFRWLNLSSFSLSSAETLFICASFYFRMDSLLIFVSLHTFLQQEIFSAAALNLHMQMYLINAISQGKAFKNTC